MRPLETIDLVLVSCLFASIDGHGMTRHDNKLARPGGGWVIMGRRASWAALLRASCLAFGPDTVLWALFRAVLV